MIYFLQTKDLGEEPNMKYREEEVKAKLEGKLCSYDKSVPDCVCAIYLTESHIFVSENNYDGTYKDHYVFPLSCVKDVLMEQPYKKSISDKNHDGFRSAPFQSSRAERGIINRLLDTFHKDEYFTIVINNSDGKTDKLYFILTSKGQDKFISEFNKALSNLETWQEII